MPIKSAPVFFCAALLVCAHSIPAAAATAVSGTLNAVANSTLDSAVPQSQSDSQSWSSNPTLLQTSVSANVSFNSDFVTTSGTAAASWTSPDAGTVEFDNYGWTFSVNDPNSTNSAADLINGRGGDDWTYTFTATQDGEIILDYDSSVASGNGFGLWGWAVDWTGSGTGYPVLNANDPTQSGVFTGFLTAGQTYTIGLNGNPNIAFDSPAGDYSGYMNGSFSWRIVATSVAEPSTWGLLVLGFAGLGLARYRRRRPA